MTHSGDFIRDHNIHSPGGAFAQQNKMVYSARGDFLQDNIYHKSARVIKCFRFHYWVRSVLEYICANSSDGDIDSDELGDMDQDEYSVDGDENNDVAEVDGDVDY